MIRKAIFGKRRQQPRRHFSKPYRLIVGGSLRQMLIVWTAFYIGLNLFVFGGLLIINRDSNFDGMLAILLLIIMLGGAAVGGFVFVWLARASQRFLSKRLGTEITGMDRINLQEWFKFGTPPPAHLRPVLPAYLEYMESIFRGDQRSVAPQMRWYMFSIALFLIVDNIWLIVQAPHHSPWRWLLVVIYSLILLQWWPTKVGKRRRVIEWLNTRQLRRLALRRAELRRSSY